jgi:pyridoxamine 5'-phosphate oxidase
MSPLGSDGIGSYDRGKLDESDLAPTWHAQLRRWLEDAEREGLAESHAMVLSTATRDGAPGARTVLLKGLDERGLAFFTNQGSRKGRELEENPRAALVFLWRALQRQVVIDGSVERLSSEESDAYWQSRAYASQLGALASPQSHPIESRAELERRYADAAASHPAPLARPEWWGGLRVVPSQVELWQGRADRLHDRLRYRAAGDASWVVERLAP